jgi:hypothetical protein
MIFNTINTIETSLGQSKERYGLQGDLWEIGKNNLQKHPRRVKLTIPCPNNSGGFQVEEDAAPVPKPRVEALALGVQILQPRN